MAGRLEVPQAPALALADAHLHGITKFLPLLSPSFPRSQDGS